LSSFLQYKPIDNAARFGFDICSKALSVIIKKAKVYNINLWCDWGSGKKSLMKTLTKELQNIGKRE
jgi:hypothetical protein